MPGISVNPKYLLDYIALSFFFPEYAGELRIISLKKKNEPSTTTTTPHNSLEGACHCQNNRRPDLNNC